MNNLDLDPFTSMLRREYQMKKEKARKRKREGMAAARANRSQEQIDADRDKGRESKAAARANRSQEQIDADRDKGRESKAAARGNRSQEQIDADNETNKKRMKAARENRSQEQKKADTDKDKESKAAAREDKRKKREKFRRGHIYDERRQLHTAWLIKKTGTEKYDPEFFIKYVFCEEIDEVKSRFVKHPTLDDEDIKFIKKQIDCLNLPKLRIGKYIRLGPWTCDPLTAVYSEDLPENELKLPTSFTLGKMDQTCRYCNGKGFKCEVQNTSKGLAGKNGETEVKLVDFGRLCCSSGSVKGIKDYNLPNDLADLYTNETDETAIYFRKNSRCFNNGMAMSSVAVEKGWQNRCHNKKMQSMLTAGGQLLRRIGPLEQKEGNPPRGAQCLFYGAEDAAPHRINNAFKGEQKSSKKDNMDRDIFKKLHGILIGAKNKYVETFLSVKEYVKKMRVKNTVRDIIIALHANESTKDLIHQGRLNAPRVKEVAVLMPNDDEFGSKAERWLTFNYMEPDDRVGLEFIPDYHRSYDPLQYPLLFPDGQDGWHFDLDHTLLQHINYMMMDREGITNPILYGNGVGQQFILDQYCKVELERLRWVELNQKTIRAELFSGFGDSMKEGDNPNLNQKGKRVVLPSTFIGGERYMHQQYLDSMALFQRFGRPHLFITKTANPQWKDITDALKPGQTAFDRPDIVGRVFKGRKQKLLEELHSGSIFGKCVARTHCIEFQKRGLPHVHILIWLKIDRHFNPSTIDEIICAEIPNPKIDNVPDKNNPGMFQEVDNPLYKKVTTSMLHGPCGTHNPTRSCMCDGCCKYNYPKDYVQATELSEDGFPRYRRRNPALNDKVSFSYEVHRNKKLYKYTSKDVIPYSKYLMQRFNCHINVEYCHSINAIKYLFGYIYKGCDQATVEVKAGPSTKEDDWTGTVQVQNEVLEYKTKRYVSSAEGCWRLRGNEVAERKPAVFRLNVHLPDEHTVYFNPDDYDIENFQHKLERSKSTPLTAYFDLVRKVNSTKRKGAKETDTEKEERELVNSLLFRHIPEHYTWDRKKKQWKRRKRGVSTSEESPESQIARVYSVHPTEMERYSLRLLLNHVAGKESFEDLRTVHGEVFPTFHAAAVALNLVQNDQMWVECMNEAYETQKSGYLLSKLFVTILLNCHVGNPETFYENFSAKLSQDIDHRYKTNFVKHPELKHLVDGSVPVQGKQYSNANAEGWTLKQFVENASLARLQRILEKSNCTLAKLHLPEPDMEKEQYVENIFANEFISPTAIDGIEFTKKKAEEYYHENIEKLNHDQLHVFNTLKSLLEESIHCASEDRIPREGNGTLVFLDAPGGTGKSFTLNLIISWIIMNDRLVAPTAASGIAATVLHNGRTAHNQFKFPINITEDSMCNISKDDDLATFLRNASLIIIDEATMLDRYCYEALDRTLKDFTDNNTKFGGKTVLVSGDFRQLLEVIPGANRAKTVNRCLKNSKLWDEHVIHLSLSENMRVKNALAERPEDEEFASRLQSYEQWLLKLGEGTLPTKCGSLIEIPSSMCMKSKDDVVSRVFDHFEENAGKSTYYQSRAIIAATNEIVNEINEQLTNRLPGEARVFHSIDTVGDDDNPTSFPTEFLNSLHLSGMADHELVLKENSVVILLRNMDISGKTIHCML